MGVSNPRDDRAERNLGIASVISAVIPRVGNAHLQQNPILDSFSYITPPKNYLSLYIKFYFSRTILSRVRTEFRLKPRISLSGGQEYPFSPCSARHTLITNILIEISSLRLKEALQSLCVWRESLKCKIPVYHLLSDITICLKRCKISIGVHL